MTLASSCFFPYAKVGKALWLIVYPLGAKVFFRNFGKASLAILLIQSSKTANYPSLLFIPLFLHVFFYYKVGIFPAVIECQA